MHNRDMIGAVISMREDLPIAKGPRKMSEAQANRPASGSPYPFGSELSESARLLLKFFCNNLYLGQWELAEACVRQLFSDGPLLGIDIQELLYDVVEYPYGRSLGSSLLKSPHHLSWFCLQQYFKLNPNKKQDPDLDFLKKDVEFRMVLSEASEQAEAAVIQELYIFHKMLHSEKYEPSKALDSSGLSLRAVSFLRDLLLASPLLGHTLITLLRCHDWTGFRRHCEVFDRIYVECLNVHLAALSRPSVQEFRAKHIEQLCSLLSLFDPENHDNHHYSPLTALLKELVDLSEKKVLQMDELVSIMAGRTTPYLLQAFYSISLAGQIQEVVKEHLPEKIPNLTELQRELIALSQCTDRRYSWRLLYLNSLENNKHFLQVIMDTALHLIKTNNFQLLMHLMQPEEFQPLKPLILLIGWSFCYRCSTASELLNILWNQDFCRHPVMEEGCRSLQHQIDLIQWCLDKSRPLLHSSESPVSLHTQATNMFQGLENHSVLYVLYQSTCLSALKEQDVLDLLQKVSFQKEPAEGISRKTVRFAEDAKKDEGQHVTSVEQQRDVALFRSYCALKNVMETLVYCAQHAHSNLMNPVYCHMQSQTYARCCSKESFPSDASESSWFSSSNHCVDPSFPPDQAQLLYEKVVLQKLNCAKCHLNELQPLTYRVEMLENVFALLFVTHEDVQDAYFATESDTGDEAEDKQSSQESSEGLDVSFFSEEEFLPLVEDNILSKRSLENIILDTEPTEMISVEYDAPFVEDNKKLKADAAMFSTATKDEDGLQSQKLKNILKSISVEQPKKAKKGFKTGKPAQVGFLANDYLVRDILYILQDCLLDLTTTQYQILGQGFSEPRDGGTAHLENMMHILPSSISRNSLKSKVMQLSQLVSEALWRFQLVSHEQIPKQQGQILLQPITLVPDITDEFFDCSAAEKSSYSRLCSRLRQSSESSVYSGLDSEGHDTANTNDSQSSQGCRKLKKRSQLRRRDLSLSTCKMATSIIAHMLSSSSSLLAMCLQQGHLVEANQVIKLFDLEGTAEVVEASFQEVFSSAVESLQGFGCTISSPRVERRAESNSMQALASMAAAGIVTASVASVADELLAAPVLPYLPKPQNPGILSQSHSALFCAENVPVMVLLDLACSACSSKDTSTMIVECITARLPTQIRFQNTSTKDSELDPKPSKDHRVRGVLGFLHQMESHLILADFSSSISPLLPEGFPQSIQAMLTSASFPLQSERCQAAILVAEEIRKSFVKAEKALQTSLKVYTGAVQSNSREEAVSRHKQRTKSGKKVTSEDQLHTAFTRLIHVMEKNRHTSGINGLLLVRTDHQDAGEYRNYLLSMYEHVQELAHLVAETDSKSKDSLSLVDNYFTVLSEGPVHTLGRLMFGKKIPPARLEKVAGDLSLNLTHVIVHSCCPSVSSKHPPPQTQLHPDSYTIGGVVVLNHEADVDITNEDPELLVKALLIRLLHLMKDITSHNNSQGVFDANCLAVATKTAPSLAGILADTKQLMHIDLDKLSTRSKKLCFLTNVLNLLILHSHFYQAAFDLHTGNSSYCSGLKMSTKVKDRVVMDVVTRLNRFAYHVGQLGVVSIFDLRYVLLRNGLPRAEMLDGLLVDRVMALASTDPWLKYAPHPDYRLMYVISDGLASSPPIQVLMPEMLDYQLSVAERKYLANTVIVNTHPDDGDDKVVIPKLLYDHQHDIPSKKMDSMAAPYEELINYIQEHSDKEIQERLAAKMASGTANLNNDNKAGRVLPFKVVVHPGDVEFVYVFQFSYLKKFSRRLGRSSSLPSDLENSLTTSQEVPPLEGGPRFDLTVNALQYVKSESPLVAALVSLVCDDELSDLEDRLVDDYFAEEGQWSKKRRSSEMGLVDIRSYRYQKLTVDYPVLKQHLLNYIIPLASVSCPEIVKGGDALLKFISLDVDISVKRLTLCLHDSTQFSEVVTNLLNLMVVNKDWGGFLSVLNSLPVTHRETEPKFQVLHDFALCCLMKKACDEEDVRLEAYAHQCYNSEIQARAVISVVRGLSLEKGLGLLKMVLAKNLSQSLKVAVAAKLEELRTYHKLIMWVGKLKDGWLQDSILTVESVLEKSFTEKIVTLKESSTLTEIASLCTSSPGDVLHIFLEAGDFASAKIWLKLHNFEASMAQELDKEHLILLLNGQHPDPTAALLTLEELKAANKERCLEICQKLLTVLTGQRGMLFIASYLLNYLEAELDDKRKDQLRLTCIGAKALLGLPKSIRREYCHLVSEPRLLLEQLLLNMKADLAGQVFSKIHSDFERIKDDNLWFSVDDFDALIAIYATKALEFSVPRVLMRERSISRLSTFSEKQDLDSVSIASRSQYSDIGRQRRRGSEASGIVRQSQPHSPLPKSAPAGRSLLPTGSKFVMPVEPPPKDQWVPDSAATVCMVCKLERFSMFCRRHHCRRCGRVVCGACSSKTTLVRGMSSRTCNDCYEQIFRVKEEQERYHQRVKETLSGASREGSLGYSPTCSMSTLMDSAVKTHDLAGAIRHTEHEWKLQLDKEYNAALREEFYYEQTPSTSLCMSILNLHSKPKECGQLMLTLCDDLSQHLKPISPGLPNPEVDYSLVIRCGENQLMDRCDMYQSRVDLLKVLLSSSYRDLPSIQELTKIELVSRLRDKLIEDERLPLAMEVSTKCGLDTSGVWAAWGRACLKFQDYSGARDKFAKCLKMPRDRNLIQQPSKLLTEVIECLESMPNRDNSEVVKLFDNSFDFTKDLLAVFPRFSEETNLDKVRFEDCTYYLENYGTYLMVVDFFRRNGYWMKGTQFILDHRCSVEVFEEGLLMPALRSGNLQNLLDQMLMVDPTLEKWSMYYTAACRYLINKKMYHTLYEIQLFVKDFVRASVTCTRFFYQGGAQSYLDLAAQVHHLHNAQKHLQSYLEPSHWGSIPRPQMARRRSSSSMSSESSGPDEMAMRLVKSPEEVQKHIEKISIQIEVTSFLEGCLNRPETSAASVAATHIASHKYGPPTLFGTNHVRTDLVTMILLSADDEMHRSFELVQKIIENYGLDTQAVFNHVGREMARVQRYNDVKILLNLVQINKLGDSRMTDGIIVSCMVGIADKQDNLSEIQLKQAASLIDYIRDDSHKINAFILLGKLKSAYLLAVKNNNTEEVQRISREAHRLNQGPIKGICERYLQQNRK